MFLFSVLIGASAGMASATPTNPFANADEGQLQCYRPNIEKKTCQSIGAYRRTGPETYDNRALIPLSRDATLETHTPVVIRGGAVCGTLRNEDVLAGTLRVSGRIVATETARPMLEGVAQAMAPLFGKEICTKYEPTGAAITAKVSIEASYRPEMDQTVKWIVPDDGYTVAP